MKVLIKNFVNVDDLWKLSAIAFNTVLWPSYSLCVLSRFQDSASKTVLCLQDSGSKSVLWPPYSLRVLSQAISFKTVLWLVWTFRHYKWCFGQCFGRFKIVLRARIC